MPDMVYLTLAGDDPDDVVAINPEHVSSVRRNRSNGMTLISMSSGACWEVTDSRDDVITWISGGQTP